MRYVLYITGIATAIFLLLIHQYLAILVGVGSLLAWKFWRSKTKPDVAITGIIHRRENKKIKEGWHEVVNSPVAPKGYDIITHCNKPNENISVAGGSREGKTSHGEFLCLKLPERKIVISFKKFQPTKRDFDIGYRWLTFLPNIWNDAQSSIDAFRTAFFADANSRGLAIDTIIGKFGDVMHEKPKDFAEFYKILERQAGRGKWAEDIKNIITSKMKVLERATSGATHGEIDFHKGSFVIDLGSLPEEESKTYFAEFYLRMLNRIEEQEQNQEKLRIVIDEAWHLLRFRQQNSIVGYMLLQGAYYIRFLCITQNYTHLAEEYRSHFGTIFCFRDTNDEDTLAIKNGYGELVREGVQKLDETKYQFIDLKYQHGEVGIPAFTLNYEKLQRCKEEARAEADKLHGDLTSVIKNNETQVLQVNDGITKPSVPTDISPIVLDALEKNEIALTKSQISKKAELADDYILLQALERKLLKTEVIGVDFIQIRHKPVRHYYIPNTEQVHNLMLARTRERIIRAGCNIVFENKHGIQGADFTIEKNGMQIIIEVETGHKNSLGEFDKKVSEYDKPVLIVVPNSKQRERYSYLPCVNSGKARILLIPEIEEALRNWK